MGCTGVWGVSGLGIKGLGAWGLGGYAPGFESRVGNFRFGGLGILGCMAEVCQQPAYNPMCPAKWERLPFSEARVARIFM